MNLIDRAKKIYQTLNVLSKADLRVSTGQRRFEAATPNRTNASWVGASPSLNSELRYSLAQLRSFSRDLAQNDPLIKKYMRTMVKYIVGPEGPTVKAKSFDNVWDTKEKLWNKIYDVPANQLIESEWGIFTKKKNFTARRTYSIRQMLNVIVYNRRVDGEIFIRFIYDKKYLFGFSIQLIEASLCPENLNAVTRDGNLVVMGIEINDYLEPMAYWFREKPAGNDLVLQYYSNKYIRVPADEIIHYFKQEWANQLRGYPEIAQVAEAIRQLKGYEEAALFNARSGATKTMVLEYDNTGLGELTKANIGGGVEQADGTIQTQLEVGSIYVVPKGMKKADWDPAYPDKEHAGFVQHQEQRISSGLDIDYPTLSSNLSGINYTSIRHGMLDSRYGYKAEQADIREDVIEPLFAIFLKMAMLTGRLNLPMTKYDKFNKIKVIGFTPDWVDPLKDGKATNEGLANLTESYEDVLAEKGKDFDEFTGQLAYEQGVMKKLGLVADLTKTPLNESAKDE